jgi:phosphatidylinositol-3-phosphatase
MRLRLASLLVGLGVLGGLGGGLVPSALAAGPLPPIRHVFIIVLENKGFNETFGFNSAAPYLSRTLPSMGALLPNYYGVTHESLGNYIALVSGQGSNVATQSDCQLYVNLVPGTIGANGQALGAGCVYPRSVKTIADQLSARQLSWKGYMEDMGNGAGQPARCRHPALGSLDKTQSARVGDEYAARHNPFVYFHSLLDSGACARGDVPLTELPGDLRSAARTPNYTFITPNLCDDGHDPKCAGSGRPGGLVGINRFLNAWVPRILASAAYKRGGLLIVTFDESDGTDASACCGEARFPNTLNNGFLFPGLGGGRTGAVMLSPYIDPGTVDGNPYNHFTLLRSIENLFGLGHLGYAAPPGLATLGSDAFTCYRPSYPRPVHGRLPRGTQIKLAVIGQGTARRPMVEIKLWRPGSVTARVRRLHGSRWASLGPPRRGSACQLMKIGLPYEHGRVSITARASRGSERRTLVF